MLLSRILPGSSFFSYSLLLYLLYYFLAPYNFSLLTCFFPSFMFLSFNTFYLSLKFFPSFVIFRYFFVLRDLFLPPSSSLFPTFSSISVICLPSFSTLSVPGPVHCIFSIPFFFPSSFLISLCFLHICPSSSSLQVPFTPLLFLIISPLSKCYTLCLNNDTMSILAQNYIKFGLGSPHSQNVTT